MAYAFNKSASIFSTVAIRTGLKAVFGVASATGAMVYNGFDPSHLILSYGLSSALTGAASIAMTNVAVIAVAGLVGGFALTHMLIAGCNACREGGTWGYFLKKTANSAVSSVMGVAAFIGGGVGGMELATRVTDAKMFAAAEVESPTLIAAVWNGIFGSADKAAETSLSGAYDPAEIADAFEEFDLAQIDAGDVLLGITECLSQMGGTFWGGLSEAFKEATWSSAFVTPDFAAAAIVAGCAIGACSLVYWGTSKIMDKVLGSTHCDVKTVDANQFSTKPKTMNAQRSAKI